MEELVLTLPWPPSANRIWRNRRKCGGPYLHPRVGEYRAAVLASVIDHSDGIVPEPLAGLLQIALELRPPRRGYDVDNRVKPVLDALQHAGVVEDDAQFRRVCVEEFPDEPRAGGEVVARISPWSPPVAAEPGPEDALLSVLRWQRETPGATFFWTPRMLSLSAPGGVEFLALPADGPPGYSCDRVGVTAYLGAGATGDALVRAAANWLEEVCKP